jgi:hypothetical protein
MRHAVTPALLKRASARKLATHPARTALALATAATTIAVLAVGAEAATTLDATVAGRVTVKDESYVRLVKSSGSVLIDEGSAHGTIPGKVKVRFVYNGNPTVSAQITIYGHMGSIQARGSARLSSPTSSSPSFKGTLTISGGSGRYLHAHGGGTLYGVFYRRSYAITVQTEGALQY